MPAAVFHQAAELRAQYGLKTPDALHLATARHHGCTALWTNDNRLSKVAGDLVVNIIS
jgi:predicted nucleic acid-binding protein